MTKIPTDFEKQTLQHLYLSYRNLLNTNISTEIRIQKSFEEILYGFIGEDSWRPSHITPNAISEAITGSYKNLQRAHGILPTRMDRKIRTMSILKGPEQSFDSWFKFYTDNDSTILVTKKEHSSNNKFTTDQLIEIPQNLKLFGSVGFSFNFRPKHELSWLKSQLQNTQNQVIS